MSSKTNITCPEINNITFTNDPPYDILGIPQCLGKEKLEAKLYLNQNNTICTIDFQKLPNGNSTNCFREMKNTSPKITKVVILIHGFLNGFETKWLHDMKDAIQSIEENTAVIVSNKYFKK